MELNFLNYVLTEILLRWYGIGVHQCPVSPLVIKSCVVIVSDMPEMMHIAMFPIINQQVFHGLLPFTSMLFLQCCSVRLLKGYKSLS